MTIAPAIESLKQLVDRFANGGREVVGSLLEQMRAVERDAHDEALEGVSRLCRMAAETIETLVGNAQIDAQAELVVNHLTEVVTFAERCVRAVGDGIDLGSVTAPAPLQLPNAEEERHFVETVGLFVTNALGTLTDLEEDLLSLETATERQEETVSGIRRVVHTLKAEFGVLNLNAPQALCHQAETTIDACTENGAALPVDLLLQLCDSLKQFVERLAQDVKAKFGDPEPLMVKLRGVASAALSGGGGSGAGAATADDGTPIVLEVGGEFADSLPEFITEARSHLADAEVAMVEMSREPDNTDNIDLTFRAFHTIKGVAGFLNLTPLVELAHVAETLLDGARAHRFRMDAKDIDLVLAAGDMITQMIGSLEGQPAPSVTQWRNLITQLQGRSGRTEAVDAAAHPEDSPAAEAGTSAGATATVPAKVETPAPTSTPAPPQAAEVASAPTARIASEPSPAVVKPQPPRAKEPAAAADGAVKAARVERTIKVSTTRLDMLVDMVGELVIAQSMVLQDPAIQRLDSQSLTRNISQVGKITRDLQEAAMSLRMVTVKATFQKMARLVRDVAVKSGKRVALSIHGEDTELDRNVVEQISDPLVHMIRNAIDHGIEAPSVRSTTGKDPEGSLSLSAYHQGGSIVIEIADDGRGIDRAAVIDKAISKGLLPADVNKQALTDAEVFNMIFMPGFSTAAQVTDLSGRGVGMDVVRRNIEALRGKIEIDSTLGKGTTFRLRLPLTLAIIDGMIVRVGQSRYVVPTLSIEQSFCPAAKDVHVLVDRGECVNVRGSVLPIYRLNQVFAQRDGKQNLTEGILIVVEADGQRSCLFVDEIVGQQQVVIKSLGMPRDSVAGLSGGAIMTDGRVALIIDVGTMVESVLSA